ncbi:MAG: hypothetical protein IKR45_04830 [Treponema sp.]|nr:hypothetical protein [Treponema sp.]
MKTYHLTLSQKFPASHPKAGKHTFFRDKLHAAITGNADYWNKLHTIRANYDFWAKRFKKIAAGEACLSVREWIGKPYGKGSTQHEIARLTREDGIGLQQFRFVVGANNQRVVVIENASQPSIRVLAMNDGLSTEDWNDWFRGSSCSKPMAIIHFTKFRY